MACFIVFEGGDGSGKSTQARSLFRRLRRRRVKVLRTHEPGGTPLGQARRRLLKSGETMTPISELMLFEAARAQLVQQVIKPFLDQGGVVIADRFTSSTVAYQGYGRGLDRELIERLDREATGGLEPDLTVFLDLPVEVALARKAGGPGDNFDDAPLDFHRAGRVRPRGMVGPRRPASARRNQPPDMGQGGDDHLVRAGIRFQ